MMSSKKEEKEKKQDLGYDQFAAFKVIQRKLLTVNNRKSDCKGICHVKEKKNPQNCQQDQEDIVHILA